MKKQDRQNGSWVTQLAASLTSRRGARIAAAIAVLIVGVLFGALSSTDAPARNEVAPTTAESTQLAAILKQFPSADKQSVLIVATAADGQTLSTADTMKLQHLSQQLSDTRSAQVSPPQLSEDHAAAVLSVPLTIAPGTENSVIAEQITQLRAEVATLAPDALLLQVTGGPAFAADIAQSFAGADLLLLLVTVGIVALLLIVTYRSPVLWLIPLGVVAIAEQLAAKLTQAAASLWNIQFDSGVVSVLVFGAGANYALLLISRYREELHREADHRHALRTAWKHTAPAILASNVTVVLALLTLGLAVIPGTHGLGVAAAIGLIVVLLAVLCVLPPVLALSGRQVFWPFVPRPDSARHPSNMWRRIATRTVRRPVLSLFAGVAVLGVMMLGLMGTQLGLTQSEKFRVPSESAQGLDMLAEHFPPGEAQPIWVVARTDASEAVRDAAKQVPGVVRVTPLEKTADGQLQKIMVVSNAVPGSEQSFTIVQELRETVHAIAKADALVGGAVATDLDARDGNIRDLLLVGPLILGVCVVVLIWVLRSVLAPLVLLAINLASAIAAIGAGSWITRELFGQRALDYQVPLLAFLFLVALGVDYTIFLVHRARSEAAVLGTREAMISAVAGTGGVITSAGIVLAGVFAALGVLPLVTIAQLGVIVGVGVIIDTIVVRTMIVPAVFGMLGDRVWWPAQLRSRE